jgi:hypothetical protein
MSYRRGYQDGCAGRAKSVPDNGIAAINNDTIGGTVRPFADCDYEQGYSAGANDAKWTRHYAGAGLRDNNGRSVEAE